MILPVTPLTDLARLAGRKPATGESPSCSAIAAFAIKHLPEKKKVDNHKVPGYLYL